MVRQWNYCQVVGIVRGMILTVLTNDRKMGEGISGEYCDGDL